MDILVTYSTPVVVSGVPRLCLDLGDAGDCARFTGMGDGANETLAFLYTVEEGPEPISRRRRRVFPEGAEGPARAISPSGLVRSHRLSTPEADAVPGC